MYYSQWRTHGGRGFRGSKPPPLKVLKKIKTSLFGTNRLFSYRDCRNCSHVFLCYPTCLEIVKNFHCDAIIGLLIVKLCLNAALDVGDCRNSETFLVFKAKSFLRTVTVSGAGVLCFPDTSIMCLRVSHDIDAVIWVKNTKI